MSTEDIPYYHVDAFTAQLFGWLDMDFPAWPPGGGDADYVVRYFAPSVGVAEDPATGSIRTLAPYWAARLGKSTLDARQLSARGGAMRCTVAGDRVRIAGRARLYLTGALHLRAAERAPGA